MSIFWKLWLCGWIFWTIGLFVTGRVSLTLNLIAIAIWIVAFIAGARSLR